MIKLAFHGAAGTVTGSKYLISVNEQKVLIDCGIFQGPRDLRQRNWKPLPFAASDVSAVVVTHAHVDHVGYLPRLKREGFSGKVYATPPTAEIAKICLLDSAHLQEEDAEYRNKKGLTRHKKALPLFTTEDAEAVSRDFESVNFDVWQTISRGIRFRYHVAGHILGAASVEVALDDGGRQTSILFSGDVGRYAVPLIIDPTRPPEVEYVVCESTYGGHIHPPEDPFFVLAGILDDVIARESVLLIPAFAVGRTQQITYMVNTLARQGRIPSLDIHIDSPMAIKAIDIYRKYQDYHHLQLDNMRRHDSFLGGSNVTLHRKRKSSKALNKLKGPAIIISASGMLAGGRILHHLLNRLADANTTLALVGFMAQGTLGRKILDGDKLVYIHKTSVDVKARIIKLMSLSGHADYYELMHWLEPMTRQPRMVFVTHGEKEESKAMADHIKQERGWPCRIPSLDETVEL